MFDFTKSYSSKSNLVKALKKVFTADEIAAFAMYEAEGRWYASDASEVLKADDFEATETELAAQIDRPKADETKAADDQQVFAMKIKVTQLTPPAPVAKSEPVKAGKIAAPKQNGISYPRAGGECWKAWQMFDEIGNVAVLEALKEGVKRGLNDNNIRIELCRWRKFNGFAAVARTKKA